MSAGIMGSLPSDNAGVGSAINNTSRALGSALGIAVMGSLLTNEFPWHPPPQVLQERQVDEVGLKVGVVADQRVDVRMA